MTDKQFFWYMVCQWILTVGTIVLAIVAIWGHVIRMRWFGPKLRIGLKSAEGEVSMFSDGVISRYYHLCVYNERRASPAHNVRVVLRTLYRPIADGTMSQITLSGPLQLAWQFQGNHPQFQTVGAESICDFGHLRKGEVFKLCTLFHHISFDPTIGKGQKIIVTIVALADEVESNELVLEVAWDGEWSEGSDEMMKHLIIKESVRKLT